MNAMENDPNSALYKFEHSVHSGGTWLVNQGAATGGWIKAEGAVAGKWIAKTGAERATQGRKIGGWLWQSAEDMAQASGNQFQDGGYPPLP